ncbi:MAG: hypothetical protein ACR2FY_24835 [Pirellulaceae bacterium]
MYVLIGILMLMLVVNWTYLVLASRHTSRLSDVLAYSAVTELLDHAWLMNHANFGSATQADDITAANDAVTNAGTGFLKRNNDVAGMALRASSTNPGEVTIVAARVPVPSQVASGANFNPAPAATEPYNTLRVEIFRNPAGPNPVLFMMRGFGSPSAAKITGAATVTLDARLVGFRPSGVFRAPVAPLALDQTQFFTVRQAGALDSNGNGIKELDFYLNPTGGGETLNAALVSLHTGLALDNGGLTIENQIRNGESSTDFAGGFLGPVAPLGGVPYTADTTISVDADRNSNNGSISASGLANAFDDVRISSYPRRVFPVYSGYSDPLTIVGFVGARIVNADSLGGRLRLRLEPDFIVHATAETRQTQGGNPVPENIYIHKTRLTR